MLYSVNVVGDNEAFSRIVDEEQLNQTVREYQEAGYTVSVCDLTEQDFFHGHGHHFEKIK